MTKRLTVAIPVKASPLYDRLGVDMFYYDDEGNHPTHVAWHPVREFRVLTDEDGDSEPEVLASGDAIAECEAKLSELGLQIASEPQEAAFAEYVWFNVTED